MVQYGSLETNDNVCNNVEYRTMDGRNHFTLK